MPHLTIHNYILANVAFYLFLFVIWSKATWQNVLLKMALGVMLIASVYFFIRP